LERKFLELCRAAGLPAPAVNVVIAGMEVDVVWREARLVVELDGHEFHRTRAAFERDRRRDAALQVAGYRVYRVTYRELAEDAVGVMATARALLVMGRG
jgi:very-short-patch-repair endonuclease